MRTLIFALAAYDDQRLLRDAPPQQQMRLEGWRPKQPLPFEEWLQTPAGRHADELMKAAGSRGEPGSAGGYSDITRFHHERRDSSERPPLVAV